MGKRKITCNNSSCKHHTNGGCDTCITLDGSGKCKSFEKGFAYYFHIVWDALDNKNFIDMVEIRMNPDLKTGLFYVMECYDLGFSEMEWGTCRMVMLKDGKEGKPLKYEEIIEREMNMEKFSKHLENFNIPTKAIDYVEINEKAVRSYNSMFREELEYKTQTVVGWNLKPDILIHGSPCQDMSIAGHQGKATGDGRINRGKGSDEGSGTRSSLMWETIHIIENMGEWRPRYVIWENVKNVKSKYMRPNFDRYMDEMEKLGYTNNYAVLDAREFGLPQARERVFTVSVLNGEKFEFDDLIRTPMRNLQEFLEDDVPDIYDVTQPSVLACIGEKGIRRATVIKDCAYTITTRQDRTPAQVIDRGDGRYRYLTERECWRLMGYSDEDFDRAKAVQERNGKYYKALYDQAGNSIAVPIFESIFRKIILQEVA